MLLKIKSIVMFVWFFPQFFSFSVLILLIQRLPYIYIILSLEILSCELFINTQSKVIFQRCKYFCTLMKWMQTLSLLAWMGVIFRPTASLPEVYYLYIIWKSDWTLYRLFIYRLNEIAPCHMLSASWTLRFVVPHSCIG